MSRVMRDSNGVIVGTCDAGLPLSLGDWQWIPRSRLAADTDINVEIDEPVKTLADVIPGYNRLR